MYDHFMLGKMLMFKLATGKPDQEGAAGARGLRVRVAAGRTLNLPVNFKLNESDPLCSDFRVKFKLMYFGD